MMKRTREFDNILEECLERVLIKGETVEQCLAAYPEHAAELEPLLQTVLVAKEASAIKPRPEFRERASYQFQAALREMGARKSRSFFSQQPQWATAVIVVIVLLLAGSGTVVAAGNSLPDEPLYQVKLATETVRLALTPSALGKAELYVKLADKRVAEIIEMADKGEAEQVEQTAQRLNMHLLAMASLAVSGGGEQVGGGVATFEAAPSPVTVEEAPQPEVKEVPRVQVEKVPQVQISEEPSAAVEEKPKKAVEEAPQATARETPREQVKEVAPAPAPTPAPAPAPTSAPVPTPVEEAPAVVVDEAPLTAVEEAPVVVPEVPAPLKGLKPDELAELRLLLSQRAVENPKALWELLERAPESVKPALRQAIEQAIAAYEQALRNLD
jgi:hypothetical protein